MKKYIGLALGAGLLISLTGCASSPKTACDAYFAAIDHHLASTVDGQADYGQFLQDLNGVRAEAPQEMKDLLNIDLENMASSSSMSEMPTETMAFCKQFLGN